MSNPTFESQRPTFPVRAVVTAGMPYGNKGLHFGHIGGVFVPADVYARFLRDRIGSENVIFVSGTDCYGSPIAEGYRKRVEDGFDGTIESYVQENHDKQAAALNQFDISLDIYEGSGLGDAREVHAQMSADIISALHDNNQLEKRTSKQFYDPEVKTFLNGRQVIGRCPVQGCKSEKAYADECDLGHQFDPQDLIAPISQLSGKKPEMVDVDNFYFKLPEYREFIKTYNRLRAQENRVRPVVTKTIDEFLDNPRIFVKKEFFETYESIKDQLPEHSYLPVEKGKASFELVFDGFESRDRAREILAAHEIRFRTGKALVPFRLTGNIEWGVPAPELDGVSGLTVWVWPESLWAPISFCKTRLLQDERAQQSSGEPAQYSSHDWRDWWCSEDAEVYQFIGQDNIYFYGVAQTGLFEALAWGLKQTTLVANHHILFLGAKASSSGTVKPPLADELLSYYTAEQLRAHWIALGLDKKSVSFKPKVFDPENKDNQRAADPALKESALLTNVFNRLARSCFYGVQKESHGELICLPADEAVITQAHKALLEYEQALANFEFTTAFSCADEYIRAANKRWSQESKAAQNLESPDDAGAAMKQALSHAWYALHAACLMMHPIVPQGCEMICDYLNLDPKEFFSWEHAFDSLEGVVEASRKDRHEADKTAPHVVRELPARTDFFTKHESQYAD